MSHHKIHACCFTACGTTANEYVQVGAAMPGAHFDQRFRGHQEGCVPVIATVCASARFDLVLIRATSYRCFPNGAGCLTGGLERTLKVASMNYSLPGLFEPCLRQDETANGGLEFHAF